MSNRGIRFPSNPTGRQLPLTVRVEGAQLVMRIGLDTLALAYQRSDSNHSVDIETGSFKQEFTVVDQVKFADGVASALQEEDEDGSTALTRALDAACERAVENDCGVEEHDK